MVFLTTLYFTHSVYCLMMLSLEDFESLFTNRYYAKEIYEYSMEIEWLKLTHSITLFGLALLIACMTARYEIFVSENFYTRILWATLIISVAFGVPCFLIFYLAFKDASNSLWTTKYIEDAQFQMPAYSD